MTTPNIQFTVQDIYELHKQLEDAFVLSSGIRDENLLISAVNAPFQTFMGNDLYPSIYDKSAQLCYGIANNHPFTDGNKRTALHSMYVSYYQWTWYYCFTTRRRKPNYQCSRGKYDKYSTRKLVAEKYYRNKCKLTILKLYTEL